MESFKIELPPGTPLINVNGREHWHKRAGVTASLRELACLLAKKNNIPRLSKVRIRAVYYAPDGRRRDAPNVLYLSSKACIDGLVDAGVLVDDSDKYVKSLELLPGEERIPGGQMVIEIIEVEARDDDR